MLLRVLLQLRYFLPSALWRVVRASFWFCYWGAERRRETKKFGEKTPRIRGSERALLIEKICDHYPFSSLMEIGCAYGQNFHSLLPFFPEVPMVGIDIDPERVEAGNALLAEERYEHVRLFAGDAKDLDRLKTDSIDLVYSSACLLYIADEKIEDVLKEMLRIARCGVLLLEQQANEEQKERGGGIFVEDEHDGVPGYWIRDYVALLEQFVHREQVSMSKVPSPIWPYESWKELAHVIEVRL